MDDEDVRRIARNKLKPISSDSEARQWIEHVDFKVITSIIRDIAKRCGADLEDLNVKTLEDVYQTKSGSRGLYNLEADMIGINIGQIIRLDVGRRAKQLYILSTIIHEYIHAISYRQFSDYDEREGRFKKGRLGLSIKKPKGPLAFLGLEEAMTSMLETAILSEYLERTGWMSLRESEELFSKKQRPNPDESTIRQRLTYFLRQVGVITGIVPDNELPDNYKLEQELIDKTIQYLEKVTGISREVIFQAFVREKIKGETDLVDEWKRLFIELIGQSGSDLHESLANLNAYDEGSKIALRDRLSDQPYEPQTKEYRSNRQLLK